MKPANILLDDDGDAYLSDFGLTKQASSQSGLTQTGQLVGTVDYVAPEQITGGDVDGRADVYSLGCVLFECVTRSRPFARDTEVAVIWSHVNDAPPPTGNVALDQVLAKGMAKKADDRYATAGELVAAGRRALGLSSGEIEQLTVGRRPPLRLLAVAGALALAAIAAAVVLFGRGGEASLSAVSGNAVGVIDPSTNRIVADIPVGGLPTRVTAGPSGVWVADTNHGTVQRLDPKTRAVATRIGIGARTTDVSADRDLVWATNPAEGTLVPVDPAREVVNDPVRVRLPSFPSYAGAFPTTVVAGGGSVWANGSPTSLSRLVDGRLRSRLRGLDTGIDSLAFGEGALWLIGQATPTVVRIDPRSERRTPIPLVTETADAPFLSAIAAGAGGVWIATLPAEEGEFSGPDRTRPGRIIRIDARLGGVTSTIEVGRDPEAVAVGAGAVWVANAADGTISRIDSARDAVDTTIRVGHAPIGIAVAGGLVWVSVAQVPPT